MTTYNCKNPKCSFSIYLDDGEDIVIDELCPGCIYDELEQQSLAAKKQQEMIYT